MTNAWALLYDELYDEEGKMITPDDERDYLKWVKENGGFEYGDEDLMVNHLTLAEDPKGKQE